jgi:3-oxoacyl-[acyl-carrier protein] reductase
MLIEPTLRSELLAGQVAIVTGGSRGIGGATSETLVANGARVVIADVDETQAHGAADGLNAEYGDASASAHVADLVAPKACDELVAATLAAHDRLDIVVNNAGYAWDAGTHAMTDEQFQAMLDIHLIVPFRLARATAPYWRHAARRDDDAGTIQHRKTVMVSSGAALMGLPGAANYASAKAGMLGLMRTLAREWGPHRVNVNAVAFGVIQTRFGLPQSDREVIVTGGRTIHVGMPAKQAERLGVVIDPDHVPTDEEIYRSRRSRGMGGFGRTGTIREAADAIFWLASPLADYVSGQTVSVAGSGGAM